MTPRPSAQPDPSANPGPIALTTVTEPSPNGTSPMVIGLSSAGAVLVAVGAAAIYLNIRHRRHRRIKSMRTEPPRWAYPATHNLMTNNHVTQVVVKS